MFVEHSDIGKKTAGHRARFSHCDSFLKIAKFITFTKATVKGVSSILVTFASSF